MRHGSLVSTGINAKFSGNGFGTSKIKLSGVPGTPGKSTGKSNNIFLRFPSGSLGMDDMNELAVFYFGIFFLTCYRLCFFLFFVLFYTNKNVDVLPF